MKLFKTTQKLPPLENKKREYPKIPYRLVKSWNTEKAKTHYELYTTGLCGGGYSRIDWHWRLEATGNKTWAERTAKHYGIEIEEQS